MALNYPSILIVEDDPFLAMELEESLVGMGCEVLPAEGLDDGFRLASIVHCDAALLDFDLGGGNDSIPIAERLAERGIPFAFVTGTLPSTVKEIMPGATILPKPLDGRRLEGALQALLSPDQ